VPSTELRNPPRVSRRVATLSILLSLFIASSGSAALLRQPYLQSGTTTSMTIAWRTDTVSDSRVHYGTIQGTLDQTESDPALVLDHFVTLTGLTPHTRYYYDVGSTTGVEAGGTLDHFLVTSPEQGSVAPFSIWLVGDAGLASAGQTAVRDAMLAVTAGDPPDIFLHAGDMVYFTGTDAEFTNNFYTPYADILRNTVFWPSIGNHELFNSASSTGTGPYYEGYLLPTAGEAGGVPSGTEAYYSFDYGNAHFIALDSSDSSLEVAADPTSCAPGEGGDMYQWLCSDLASTTSKWIIAYGHYPPYSKGSHDSDVGIGSEVRMVDVREGFLPLLEAYGVDLVLSGHSHIYERSYLINQAYGYGSSPNFPTPNLATLEADGHILDSGDGSVSGDGAYIKFESPPGNSGTVYVVAGHGAAFGGGTADHPVMYHSELDRGSVVIDVASDALTLRNIRHDQVITDEFTLLKYERLDVPSVAASAWGQLALALFLLAAASICFLRMQTLKATSGSDFR
jgi:hypothetical protein